jgi:hypothetical protein
VPKILAVDDSPSMDGSTLVRELRMLPHYRGVSLLDVVLPPQGPYRVELF